MMSGGKKKCATKMHNEKKTPSKSVKKRKPNKPSKPSKPSKKSKKKFPRKVLKYIGVRQRGVSSFSSSITIGSERTYLGTFGSAKEAARAFDQAAIKAMRKQKKSLRPLNFPQAKARKAKRKRPRKKEGKKKREAEEKREREQERERERERKRKREREKEKTRQRQIEHEKEKWRKHVVKQAMEQVVLKVEELNVCFATILESLEYGMSRAASLLQHIPMQTCGPIIRQEIQVVEVIANGKKRRRVTLKL